MVCQGVGRKFELMFRKATAFVGSHQWPQHPGNVIVIPNEHYENLYDIPPPHMARVQELAQAIACAMKAMWECDGVSTRQHNEPAGAGRVADCRPLTTSRMM